MLHHIEIYVKDLKKTKVFYDFLLSELGYRIYQEWDQGISYRFKDEYYLVFVQTEDAYLNHDYHRKHVGLNHLAFSINTREEVDELRARLLKNGVNELYKDDYPFAGGKDYFAFYFEDPDRIKLELVSLE